MTAEHDSIDQSHHWEKSCGGEQNDARGKVCFLPRQGLSPSPLRTQIVSASQEANDSHDLENDTDRKSLLPHGARSVQACKHDLLAVRLTPTPFSIFPRTHAGGHLVALFLRLCDALLLGTCGLGREKLIEPGSPHGALL